MHATHIQLVQSTFATVHLMADAVAEMFYDCLFAIDPSTRELFKGDLKKQRAMLVQAIGLVVNGLDRPETITLVVQGLGRRHVDYGVTPDHYHSVGEALLWTLEQWLGEGFTPEVKATWTEAYGLLAGMMRPTPRPTSTASSLAATPCTTRQLTSTSNSSAAPSSRGRRTCMR